MCGPQPNPVVCWVLRGHRVLRGHKVYLSNMSLEDSFSVLAQGTFWTRELFVVEDFSAYYSIPEHYLPAIAASALSLDIA